MKEQKQKMKRIVEILFYSIVGVIGIVTGVAILVMGWTDVLGTLQGFK